MGLGGVRGLVCLVHGLGWGQEDIAIPLGLLELQLAADHLRRDRPDHTCFRTGAGGSGSGWRLR